jgi:hypothetical protein
MPSHRKRPRDPAQLAKLVADIATGQVEDREPTSEEQGKDPAAVKRGTVGGKKGGPARALTRGYSAAIIGVALSSNRAPALQWPALNHCSLRSVAS